MTENSDCPYTPEQWLFQCSLHNELNSQAFNLLTTNDKNNIIKLRKELSFSEPKLETIVKGLFYPIEACPYTHEALEKLANAQNIELEKLSSIRMTLISCNIRFGNRQLIVETQTSRPLLMPKTADIEAIEQAIQKLFQLLNKLIPNINLDTASMLNKTRACRRLIDQALEEQLTLELDQRNINTTSSTNN